MKKQATIIWAAAVAGVILIGSFAAAAQQDAPAAPRTTRRVIVSIPDRKLAVLEQGVTLATFSVAVGAEESPSPVGEFRIINRVASPTYYHPGTVIPSGSNNPIGTRWIGLNAKGYGIHGTNVPSSIGKAASHGCIRLRNREMEQLFAMLRTGDIVEIRAARDEETARLFGSDEEFAGLTSASQEEGQ